LTDFAALLQAETVSGGAGNDILSITATGTINASDLLSLNSVETISLASAGTQTILLSDAVYTANGATTLAITEAGTATISVNAAGLTAANSVQITTRDAAVNETLVGGAGNDTFTQILGTGTIAATDTITGGAGTDTLVLSTTANGTVDFTGVTGIETISSSVATGGATTNTITFAAIPDALLASGITLTMNLSDRTGSVIMNATNSEADGKFNITTGTAADTIYGGDGADTVDAGSGADTISGGAGADSLVGNAGNDSILGGTGADSLTGGSGSDVFQYTLVAQSSGTTVDTISDFSTTDDQLEVTLNYASVITGVTVNATRATAGAGITEAQASLTGERGQYVYDTTASRLYVNVNNDNLLTALDYSININAASTATATVATSDINFIVTGTSSADTITTDGGTDTINMGQGDSVNGGAGVDTFAFAAVTTASTITGGTGADVITLAAGTNSGLQIGDTDGFTLSGGTINTVTFTTALAATTITGGSGVDTYTFAGAVANVATVTGGTGADVIDLGATTTGITSVVIAAGDSTSVIGGAGNNGTASVAFDAITNVTTGTTAANKDKIDVVGTASVAAAATVNGADSTLTIGNAVVGEHTVSATGLTTFVVANGGAAQVVVSDASLAAVLQYLSGVDIGAAGQSLVFTATYAASTRGSVTHSFVYTQNSANAASAGGADDGFTLIDFIGVTLVGLETTASTTNNSLFIA